MRVNETRGSKFRTVTVAEGSTINDVCPSGGAFICKYNGEWAPRRDWGMQITSNDLIEFHEVFEARGGDGSKGLLRTILTVALMIVISIYAPQLGPYWVAALTIGGNLLINALLPVKPPDMGTAPGSGNAVYSVTTAANQARLMEAIPVIYGRHLIYPDYAAQPYISYQDNDQYFYALFTIGQGSYTLESTMIDDTKLSSFDDVLVARILAPGQQPSDVSATVVNSAEVSNQDLLDNRYVGGYAANGPRTRTSKLSLDFVFPRGIGKADPENGGSNGLVDLRISWQVEIREIDDFGVGISRWSVLGVEVMEMQTTTPQRRTYTYSLAKSMRCEVRVVRRTIKETSSEALDDLVWGGMRAFLDAPGPLLSPTATHFELKMRASEQLSGSSQRKINMIVQRLLPVWNGTTWSAPVATRNPMWALVDVWRNQSYGEGRPDSRIDLDSVLELAELADERQDRFDYIFSSQTPAWQAAGLIGAVMRVTPFRRNGVYTVTRDQQYDLPVTSYTSRDIIEGSFSANFQLATENMPDSIIVEYFDYKAWDWLEIQVPMPGVDLEDSIHPIRTRKPGITGPTHARREALYAAANSYYRRAVINWDTEMQALLPAFGSLVLVAPAMPGWGLSGDVVAVSGATVDLSEPALFPDAQRRYISFSRPDGSYTPPVRCFPGEFEDQVVLQSIPPDMIEGSSTNYDDRERPRFLFGTGEDVNQEVRLTSIERSNSNSDDGGISFSMSGVMEDDRVHTADNALLPAPGQIQDPVNPATEVDPGDGTGGDGGGSLIIIDIPRTTSNPYVNVHTRTMAFDNHSGYETGRVGAGIKLSPDGYIRFGTGYLAVAGPTQDPTLTWTVPGNPSNSFTDYKWVRYIPIEVEDAARFQVRFRVSGTSVPPGVAVIGSALDTWLDLNVERPVQIYVGGRTQAQEAYVDANGIKYRRIRIDVAVREKSSGIVQDTTLFQMQPEITITEPGG